MGCGKDGDGKQIMMGKEIEEMGKEMEMREKNRRG
jgi:hypothetical protein